MGYTIRYKGVDDLWHGWRADGEPGSMDIQELIDQHKSAIAVWTFDVSGPTVTYTRAPSGPMRYRVGVGVGFLPDLHPEELCPAPAPPVKK